MIKTIKKQLDKLARIRRVRAKIKGSASRPRLVIEKTARHFGAQIIDDTKGTTLASISSKNIQSKNQGVKLSVELGELFGQKLKDAGIQKITFDRRGNKYHGRISAFAEAVRKSGIIF